MVKKTNSLTHTSYMEAGVFWQKRRMYRFSDDQRERHFAAERGQTEGGGNFQGTEAVFQG